MKPVFHLLIGIASAFALLTSTHAWADPRGIWDTEDQEAQVEVHTCGDSICGKLVWLGEPLDAEGNALTDAGNPDKALRNEPILGLQILWDMEATDSSRWEGGHVYDPETGKTYKARITLEDADTLLLRGYVGAPMFGRTSTWTRAPERKAASAP